MSKYHFEVEDAEVSGLQQVDESGCQQAEGFLESGRFAGRVHGDG